MINILEILKKVSNIKDIVFYSPLYGDVKVEIEPSSLGIYNIWISPKDDRTGTGMYITEYGLHQTGGECMLYPSRQQRDWSKFKIPRKDLPRDTPVIVSDSKYDWRVRAYAANGVCYSILDDVSHIEWAYIIPVNKFNFKDWSFNEEDNYGLYYKNNEK